MQGVFVTGTDTGVGKTVVSAVIARSRGWGYWKPIQAGPESDTETVARLAGCAVHDQGVRLPDPVSPHLAAQRAGVRIRLEDLPIPQGEWVVEGAGGVLVPVNERETMLDLMTMLALPVVVAARTTLGTINHTLLTLKALRDRGVLVEKVVLVGARNPDNAAAILEFGAVTVDELPWFAAPNEPLSRETVARYAL